MSPIDIRVLSPVVYTPTPLTVTFGMGINVVIPSFAMGTQLDEAKEYDVKKVSTRNNLNIEGNLYIRQ